MNPDSKPSHPFRDPHAKLSMAIDILERFSTRHAQDPFPHIYQHAKDRTLFKKIIFFTKYCIAATFSGAVRKKNELEREKVEEEVLKAIDDVQRYHPLISKNCSTQEKELVTRVGKTISDFNRMVESAHRPATDWRDRLLRFLIKRTPLSFGKPRKIELHSSEKPTLDKVATFVEKQDLATSVSEREVDVFRMKAISLLRNHGVHFPSIKDVLSSLQESPIYTSVSRDAARESIAAASVLCLEQTLTPFPGETIILRGSFRRDPNAIALTTPIPDSFKLGVESVQTGFPHPSQHVGWSLSDSLIPPMPHRAEKLKHLPMVLQKKKKVAEALMKQDGLSVRAKESLKFKRTAVENNKKEFLSLHEKLCLTMLSSAPSDRVLKNSEESIYQFFGGLQGRRLILDEVSKWYHEMNREFVLKPFEVLNQAWRSQTSKGLLSSHTEQSREAARKILQSALAASNEALQQPGKYPPVVVDFLLCMGNMVGAASQNIILQYFSEVIEFFRPNYPILKKKFNRPPTTS